MNFPFYIARRYLVAKKSHQAIQVVSWVAVCGVAVGTMALVCVLSVFNGFQGVVEGLFSNFDPQLRIEAVSGKVFDSDSVCAQINDFSEVCLVSQVLQDHALLRYRDKQMPVTVKGVDSLYHRVNRLDSILLDGEFKLKHGDIELAVGGAGLARTLGCGVHFTDPLQLYAPKRQGKVNMLRPDEAFCREICYLNAVFMVQQEKYDNSLLLVSLPLARRLFNYQNEVSALELKLLEGSNEQQVAAALQHRLGPNFVVADRYRQQAEFFRMLQIEKWITYLILSFILFIAAFNIVGSLTMLMIDKKQDMRVLSNMGASARLLSRVFLTEGCLIALVGALIGLLLGLVLCLLQQHFGFISMGASGAYIVDAYPVEVHTIDLLIIFATVVVIGFFASLYPARQTPKYLI